MLKRTLLVALLCMTAMSAAAQKPTLVKPLRDDIVLERLPPGYSALATTQGPAQDPLTQAEIMLAAASRSGDARLASRAEARLDALGPSGGTRVLLLRAYLAQHRHDFRAALRLLDRYLQAQPRDADARHMRAQIHLVTGRIDLARADCAALALSIDSSRGQLCIAAIAQRKGDLRTAAALLDRWLERASASDPLRRHALLRRAEIASRAGEASADAWYLQALALQADDAAVLAAYARHLRIAGRPAETLHLLAGKPDSDRILLERALAARILRDAQTPVLSARLDRRYHLAHSVGNTPELRDEAEFRLVMQGDAAAALSLAVRNFSTQRDSEDVSLLCRASAAAGQPGALQSLRDWAARQGVRLDAVTCPRT
jgi:hypothetical protein